jgi:hypothetical protein
MGNQESISGHLQQDSMKLVLSEILIVPVLILAQPLPHNLLEVIIFVTLAVVDVFNEVSFTALTLCGMVLVVGF